MWQQTPLRFHVTVGGTFSKSTSLGILKMHYKSAFMEILQAFETLPHVDCSSAFRNSAFDRVVWRSFSQSVISEIHYLLPSSFFPKCLKRDVNCIKWTKNWEKFFRFLDNCIWIGNGKFSQSSIGHLPSAVNVLRNIPNISRNSKGDKFQIKFP